MHIFLESYGFRGIESKVNEFPEIFFNTAHFQTFLKPCQFKRMLRGLPRLQVATA